MLFIEDTGGPLDMGDIEVGLFDFMVHWNLMIILGVGIIIAKNPDVYHAILITFWCNKDGIELE